MNNALWTVNVVVTPRDAATGTSPVTIIFASVTSAGTTSLLTTTAGPTPPIGFSAGTPPTYYELSTTATFTTASVCIVDATLTAGSKLFHYQPGPVNVTTSLNLATKTICGMVASFSPFLIPISVDAPIFVQRV
jgi:hypothetical protein